MIDKRNCDDCIFHDGRCTRWDCKPISRKDAEKAFDEWTPKKRLIIRTNIMMSEKDALRFREDISRQMEDGVVLLPPYCEVIENQSDTQIEYEEAENEDQNDGHRD